MGGALYLASVVDIQSANIYNNEAQRGGGICMVNYDGGAPAFNGMGFNLKIEDNVRIYNNTATEYGGGVFAYVRATEDVGFDHLFHNIADDLGVADLDVAHRAREIVFIRS